MPSPISYINKIIVRNKNLMPKQKLNFVHEIIKNIN